MIDMSIGASSALLSIDVEPDRDRVIVRPVGEIDISNVHHLEREARDLLDRGFDALVLDLSELRFIDGRGLRCIREIALALGDGLTLCPGPHAVQRALEVGGLLPILRFERARRFARQPAA